VGGQQAEGPQQELLLVHRKIFTVASADFAGTPMHCHIAP
jgi:hypothetical protein